MIMMKEALRIAFEAGKRQQQIEGTKWYPTKKESDQVFNKWYNNFKRRKKK